MLMYVYQEMAQPMKFIGSAEPYHNTFKQFSILIIVSDENSTWASITHTRPSTSKLNATKPMVFIIIDKTTIWAYQC